MVGAASGTHNHKNKLAPVNPPIWAPSFVLPKVISAGVGLILLSPAKLSVVTRTPIANEKTAGTKRYVGGVLLTESSSDILSYCPGVYLVGSME